MARYKTIDASLRFLAVDLERQLIPVTATTAAALRRGLRFSAAG